MRASISTLLQSKIIIRVLLILLLSTSCAFSAQSSSSQEKVSSPKFAFINPTVPGEPFWSLMTDMMQATASNLEVELNVYYGEKNRFKSLDLAKSLLSAKNKPDYLIFHFQAQVATKILDLAEAAGVYSLVINTDTHDADKMAIGKPREKYKYWLGHISPDDLNAGAMLANALITKAHQAGKQAKDGKVHMIGLTGTADNTASLHRVQGLKGLVMQRNDVVLHQVVDASWDQDKAKRMLPVLLVRYPETSVVWAASDLMALGAIEALSETKLKPGVDIFLGGIDGIPAGLLAIRDGKLSASVTGHFVEGAWAMLFLYAHAQGQDLMIDKGKRLASEMIVLDKQNVESFIRKLNSDYFNRIDFKQYLSHEDAQEHRSIFSLPDTIMRDLRHTE